MTQYINVALLCLMALRDASAATNIRGSWIDTHHLQAAEISAATSHHRRRADVDWVKVGWIAGVTIVVSAVIAGIVIMVKKKQAAQAEAEGRTGSSAPKKVDYKALLTGLSKRITEEVGPKFGKDGACRKVLEKRFENFQDKAKNFLLSEMNTTAASVMSELEAEESLMMLEWNNAIESNFPPVSILVAGLLSPQIVDFMSCHHFLQFLTVALPLFMLCVWAIYTDLIAVKQPCDAIPSLYAWLYTQTVLSLMLFVGHGCLLAQLRAGKKRIQAKKEEVEYELKGKQEGGFANYREQFIGRTVILQEALMTENNVRHSFLNTIVGVATIAWLLTTTWNLVLVIGWTFVPGVVAFHPKAATAVPEEYCGAWASVFVLKVSMLLSVLYFFGNLACVVQFLCDSMINSKGFSDAVLSQARDIDKNGPGVPVTEVLAKAFLLRGGDEALISKLAVATHHTRSLQHKKADLEGKLAALNFKISSAAEEENDLTNKSKESGGGDLAAQCKKLSSETADYDNWKRQGRVAIDEAEKQITKVGAASTEALEKLYTKVDATLKEIENSETVQAAIAAAKEAEEQIQARMNEAYDMLNDPEFQAKVKQIAEEAKAECEKLGSQAKELADEAIATATDKDFQAKLQEGARKAMEEARKQADKLAAETVNNPELRKKLEEAMTEAEAKAKEAAAAVNDPVLRKRLEATARQTLDQVQQGAETVHQALLDPETQKKIEDAARKAMEEAKEATEAAAAKVNDPKLKAAAQKKLKEAQEAAEKAAKVVQDPKTKAKVEQMAQSAVDQAKALRK